MTRHLTRICIAAVTVYLLASLPELAARHTWSAAIVVAVGALALIKIAADGVRYLR